MATKAKSNGGAEGEMMFSVPFGCARETQSRGSYSWRSDRRGQGGYAILQYTLAGAGRFELEGQKWEVPAGWAFVSLVPERAVYYLPAERAAPWTFCWVIFFNAFSVEMWRRLRTEHGAVIRLPRQSVAGLGVERLARLAEGGKFADRYEASQEAYKVYLNCLRQLSQPEGRGAVEEAAAYCREHFRDRIAMKELASRSGMSREHFTRLFARRMGVGPGSYLRTRRLEVAGELLARGDLPLREVATRCGFGSVRGMMNARRNGRGDGDV